jgi:hypothetical protein
MGSLKALEAHHARLEARVAALPDPKEQEARDERWNLHADMWLLEGCFEDIPEKDRDPSMWESLSRYGPSYLGLVWEGILPGRKEYLAAGVDFARASGCEDFIGGRP